MTVILYAHPYDRSFNHAVLESLKEALKEKGKKFEVIDLHADGFNPVLDADNLALYNEGKSIDPLVDKYLDLLIKSDELFMIFPIWWSEMPAIVRGFFDKAMLVGRAYTYGENGLVPDKINIKRTVIFSTSQAPGANFEPYFVNYFKPQVLETVGMHNMEWYNCDRTAHGPEENRLDFLRLVAEKA